MYSIDYLRALQEGFATWRDINPGGAPETRLGYVGEYIFDFTTYDDTMTEEFARKALDVCRAISDGTTGDYIQDPDNYRWYLLMCNMPFFAGRLNWGTSIRGAWWDVSTPNCADLETSGLWLDGVQLQQPLKFSTDQWREFIAALLEFCGAELYGEPGQGNSDVKTP